MQHARFSIPSAFRKCIYKFEARLNESYLLGRICLIAITNRYIVLAPLQSMLIFNSKGSRPRCLSCNRIKRKTDCRIRVYIYHKIPFSLSRKKNGNFERKEKEEGQETVCSIDSLPFRSLNLLNSKANFNPPFVSHFYNLYKNFSLSFIIFKRLKFRMARDKKWNPEK